jgi:hypothetical protein
MGEAATAELLPEVEVQAFSLFLAEVVKWTHTAIPTFTLVGWALPWEQSWWVMLFLVPIMKIHWMTNDNICFLSTVEAKLRGNPHAGTQDQQGLIHRITVALMGSRSPSEERVVMYAEIGMYSGWVISALRLFVW